MVYVLSKVVAQLLCMKILVIVLSNGCKPSTSGDGCEPGWYTLEHNCVLMSNVSVPRHLAASDECTHLGGRLLSDQSAERHKECLLALRTDQKSREIWIDIVKKKSQQCGTLDLTSLQKRTFKCNQTATTPRSYFCEKNSSVPLTIIITTTEILYTLKSKRAISFQTETTTEATTKIGELCPPRFKKISQGCYMFVEEHKVWGQARMTCSINRADLVVITSSNKRDDIQHYVTSHYPNVKSLWMGFRRDVSVDWVWVNGLPMDSNVSWVVPELRTMKRKLCGTLTAESQQFKLSATTCDESRVFLCEYHGRETSSGDGEGSSVTEEEQITTTQLLPTMQAPFYCPEERREVTFGSTRAGVTVQVPCPALYEGNITRTCDFNTRSWTPLYLYNCTRMSLKIASHLAKDLLNKSSEALGVKVKNITAEVTKALESNTTIVSGEIKQIVNILDQIGEASDKLVVTNDTLQSLASITDKLIGADTRTWEELSSANKTENAGSTLMKAMDDITQSYLTPKNTENITEILIVKKNIVITVANTGPTKDNITFPKPDNAIYSTNQTINRVFLSSDALNGPLAYSVIIYNNVSDKFKVYSSSQGKGEQQQIGSDVISFSLSTDPSTLSSPLMLTFRTDDERHKPVCSFLDTKQNISGVWSSEGCKTILRETTVDCHCSHLTNFAVLMSMKAPSSLHQAILGYISIIGISISLFCLCLTVTVYSVMWRYVKSDRSVLHVNLCVCLMLGYIVFLGGVTKTEQKIACTVTAALLHYLFLAIFCVMLSQGLLILKSVTSVSSTSILRYLYIIMYGTPLVIVAITLGITQGEGFGTDHSCWLSIHNGVLWSFVGPAFAVLVVNFFILFAVIRIMQKSKSMVDKNVKRKTKSVVRSIFVLAPILGVTWALGVLSVTMDLEIFQYLFAICNSLQGLLIFIFQCALQYQVKDGFRALLRRYRATSFDSSQKITSTGQSQDKGYSESGLKMTSFTNTSGSKSQD